MPSDCLFISAAPSATFAFRSINSLGDKIAGGTLEAFEWALKMARPAGIIIIIISNINYRGSGERIKANRVDWGLGMGHIKIIGGLMPGGRKNMERLSNLLKHKKLDVSRLLTNRFRASRRSRRA